MKLNIVQAVKLGTVACLLAVTTQTIGENNIDPELAAKAAGGGSVDEDAWLTGRIIDGKVRCKLNTSTHYNLQETGRTKLGDKLTFSRSGHCDQYIQGKEKEGYRLGESDVRFNGRGMQRGHRVQEERYGPGGQIQTNAEEKLGPVRQDSRHSKEYYFTD